MTMYAQRLNALFLDVVDIVTVHPPGAAEMKGNT